MSKEITLEQAVKIAEWLEIHKHDIYAWAIGGDEWAKGQSLTYVKQGSGINWVNNFSGFIKWLSSPEGEVAMMDKLEKGNSIWWRANLGELTLSGNHTMSKSITVYASTHNHALKLTILKMLEETS